MSQPAPPKPPTPVQVDSDDENEEDDSDSASKGKDVPESAGAKDAADSADADDSADQDDSADSDEDKKPKTAVEKLVALGDKACSLLIVPRDTINRGIARATNLVSAAVPALPAATLCSMAVGLPHAHPAHPPFIPLSPMGPALLGFSTDVVINGVPALQSGALGVSPTCCGLSPFYEVFTGSSKVLISGERAVRVLDLTFHCMPAPLSSHEDTGAAGKLQRALRLGESAAHAIHRTADAVDTAGAHASAADAVHKAAQSKSPAEKDAAVDSVLMATASPIADKVQATLYQVIADMMGRDPAAPSGTPGVIVHGARNVLIGGMPIPSVSATARGLLRLVPKKFA